MYSPKNPKNMSYTTNNHQSFLLKCDVWDNFPTYLTSFPTAPSSISTLMAPKPLILALDSKGHPDTSGRSEVVAGVAWCSLPVQNVGLRSISKKTQRHRAETFQIYFLSRVSKWCFIPLYINKIKKSHGSTPKNHQLFPASFFNRPSGRQMHGGHVPVIAHAQLIRRARDQPRGQADRLGVVAQHGVVEHVAALVVAAKLVGWWWRNDPFKKQQAYYSSLGKSSSWMVGWKCKKNDPGRHSGTIIKGLSAAGASRCMDFMGTANGCHGTKVEKKTWNSQRTKFNTTGANFNRGKLQQGQTWQYLHHLFKRFEVPKKTSWSQSGWFVTNILVYLATGKKIPWQNGKSSHGKQQEQTSSAYTWSICCFPSQNNNQNVFFTMDLL